jgi:hypothetical protein
MLKRRFLASAAVTLSVSLSLTACITINAAPEPIGTASSPATSSIDDSAARESVLILRGALNYFSETGAQEDCDYVALTNSQLNQATPLEEYRGSYEKLHQIASTVTGLCGDPLGMSSTIIARDLADEIMAEYPPFS